MIYLPRLEVELTPIKSRNHSLDPPVRRDLEIACRIPVENEGLVRSSSPVVEPIPVQADVDSAFD